MARKQAAGGAARKGAARERQSKTTGRRPGEAAPRQETRSAVEAAGRRCALIPGDLADADFCRELVERTVLELGKLDILVSNAAHQTRTGKFDELEDEDFDRTFKVNIYAYFRLCKAALPHMKPGASIIATSSITGIQGSQNLVDYSATKKTVGH